MQHLPPELLPRAAAQLGSGRGLAAPRRPLGAGAHAGDAQRRDGGGLRAVAAGARPADPWPRGNPGFKQKVCFRWLGHISSIVIFPVGFKGNRFHLWEKIEYFSRGLKQMAVWLGESGINAFGS